MTKLSVTIIVRKLLKKINILLTIKMDRTSIQKIFTGIFLIACIILGVNKFTSDKYGILNLETGTGSSSRMTYGRFLEYLEMGWVNQVDLYDNSRNAIVQASSPELGSRPQSIRVEIPIGASQLIQKLKDYNIDFEDIDVYNPPHYLYNYLYYYMCYLYHHLHHHLYHYLYYIYSIYYV